MTSLSYDSLKAVFKNLRLKKRLELVAKGGVFETLDKLTPRPISSLELHWIKYMIDEKQAIVRNSVVLSDYDDTEAVFQGENDSDCVRHILNLNPTKPILAVDFLLVQGISKGITYFDPKNANRVKIFVRNHLKIVDTISILSIAPLLAEPENLRKLSLLVFCEFSFQAVFHPLAENCKKLIVKGEYFPAERILPFLRKSKHQHLHLAGFYTDGTRRHLWQFIDLWTREFRPIGTTFTCVLSQRMEFDLLTFRLEDQQPTALFINDGITVPLDENRELVISCERNRHVMHLYVGDYVFRMRIMEKGFSVSTENNIPT